MNYLFDSSVLVASILEAHPFHDVCLPWLQKAKRNEIGYTVAAHSLLEVYSVMTRTPFDPPLTPSIAEQLIDKNIKQSATIIALTANEYKSIVTDFSKQGIKGGLVYDAPYC